MALGAARKTSMSELPLELLQDICRLLEDPDDLASVHLVDTRFCAAARSALHSALPQNPGFFQLALQHQYPLRHLYTAMLPFCDLASYLAQAPSSLTSLDIAERWDHAGAEQDAPLSDVLQGISSLRRLSCKVPTAVEDLDFLKPHLADLQSLSLVMACEHPNFESFQGLSHLTNLTHLTIDMSGSTIYEPLSGIAGLTKLQDLHIPDLLDLAVFSALSGLTALSLGDLSIDQPSGEDDEDIAALVEALPQLLKLSFVWFAASATNAGLCRLSRLKNLQQLGLTASFEGCRHDGLVAALATLTDLASLYLSYFPVNAFLTQQAMAGIAQRTMLTALHIPYLVPRDYGSAIRDMLQALGPRLQHLTIGYAISYQKTAYQCTPQDTLAPSILRHCPQLAQLTLEHDLWPGDTAEGMVCASLIHCTQLFLVCPSAAEASMLASVQWLSHLHIQVGSDRWNVCKFEDTSLTSVVEGLRCLVHLQRLTIDIRTVRADPLLGMLEALTSCNNLTWLELTDTETSDIGAGHLKALAALSQLTTLYLGVLRWAHDATRLGLGWLAARLPRLRVLNAHPTLLGHAMSDASLLHSRRPVASYELRDLPGRWLRRWPRRAQLGWYPACCLWDVPGY